MRRDAGGPVGERARGGLRDGGEERNERAREGEAEHLFFRVVEAAKSFRSLKNDEGGGWGGEGEQKG